MSYRQDFLVHGCPIAWFECTSHQSKVSIFVFSTLQVTFRVPRAFSELRTLFESLQGVHDSLKTRIWTIIIYKTAESVTELGLSFYHSLEYFWVSSGGSK